MMKAHVIELIERAPDSPGVYVMRDAQGRVLYVGKAVRLRDRLKSYVHPERDSRPLTRMYVPQIEAIEWLVTDNEKEALILENSLIKAHRPKYNISFRDDRSFVSLRMTSHAFPRLHVTRRIQEDGSKYFGPYASSSDVRKTLKLAQKIFKLRDCSDAFYNARKRPCLQYQIQRCSAPCVGLIGEEAYATAAKEARWFLSGQKEALIRTLREEMERASAGLDFERAAVFRDRLSSVEYTLEPQVVESRQDDRDADVIGLFGDDTASLVKILTVRGGRLIGTDEYFVEEPVAAAGEIVRAVLQSRYLEEGQGCPAQLIFDHPVQDSDLFERIL